MKLRNIIAVAVVVFSIAIVAANPNILYYHYNHWENDRNETVDVSNVIAYTEISTNPWIVEITNPQMSYKNSAVTYQNGEKIDIQVTGFGTMTLTANQPITISIT